VTTTIVALFDSLMEARNAVQEMVDSGLPRENISLVAGRESTASDSPDTLHPTLQDAEKGAVIGGLAGLFLGLSELAVPGVGLVLIGGWLAATLLGAAVGATAGGLVGLLVEAGVSHEQAGHFTENLRRGSTLVLVTAEESRTQQAVDILNDHHALKIEKRAAPPQEGNASAA
jgi:hypothetical protein